MNFIKNKDLLYIADFSLPNMSAYSIHVLKMCDAASKLGFKVNLFLPHISKNFSEKEISKNFLLKKKIIFNSIFEKKYRINIFVRLLFSFFLINKVRNYKSPIIISRSVVTSLMLALFQIRNILELHTENSGVTKLIFSLKNINFIKRNLRFIVLNKKLKDILNIDSHRTLILDDAVNPNDFNYKTKDTLKNTCVYTGSFAPGKGIENIIEISKLIPEINFHLFGNINTLKNKNKIKFLPKNIKMKGYLPYSKIGKTLSKYKILLMPYSNKVGVLMNEIFVENYFSPLKMFEYMASGKIILASDLKVYRHILKKNYNSILINTNDYGAWKKNIIKTMNSKKYSFLGKNAKKDVQKFTWNLRIKKIIQFNVK